MVNPNAIGKVSAPTNIMLPDKSSLPGEERMQEVFFDVIKSSLAVSTPEEFCAWMRGDMQKIFPHGMMACCIGQIENQVGRIHQILTCNFPPEYFQALEQPDGHFSSPIASEWIKTRRPVLFELSRQKGNSSPWLENFRQYQLKNLVAHGQYDIHGLTTSYFMFSRIPGVLAPRHAFLIDLLVPHMHVALIRALHGTGRGSCALKEKLPMLSRREHEILQWIAAGKSNWDIAQLLNISENTIRNHVQNIMAKLKVHTRSQAVAKALIDR